MFCYYLSTALTVSVVTVVVSTTVSVFTDFDFVISSCDYLFRKPNPHIFEAALARAGVTPDKVWFCGDQFLPDIQGATAAGMTAVWYKAFLRYDQDCRMTENGIEIGDWEELKEIIRRTH